VTLRGPDAGQLWSRDVRREARNRGLVLRRIARDGQRVWAWRHGKDDVGPAFVTERGALDWMARAIDRGDVADT